MWKCANCNVFNTGKMECASCKQPIPRESLYAEIPWYRRSAVMSAFVLGGALFFPPLLWMACIVCLSGDVYDNRVKKDGTLAKWPAGNKAAAVVILVLQLIGLAYFFASR